MLIICLFSDEIGYSQIYKKLSNSIPSQFVLGNDIDVFRNNKTIVLCDKLFETIHIIHLSTDSFSVSSKDSKIFQKSDSLTYRDDFWHFNENIINLLGLSVLDERVLCVKRETRQFPKGNGRLESRYLFYDIKSGQLVLIMNPNEITYTAPQVDQFILSDKVYFMNEKHCIGPIYIPGKKHREPYLLVNCEQSFENSWNCEPYTNLYIPKSLNDKYGYDLMNSRISYPLFYMEGYGIFHSFISKRTFDFDKVLCEEFHQTAGSPLNYFFINAKVELEVDDEIVHAICAVNNPDKNVYYIKLNLSQGKLEEVNCMPKLNGVNHLTWHFGPRNETIEVLTYDLKHIYQFKVK